MKVSVIIPVYEEEKYLAECIESVINQTYKDLEIIVIDDGSQDNCPQIIKDYESRDSRIIAIYKENEGPGPTRNVGIERATGDYITFLDCDDWLELDCINKMMDKAYEYNQPDLLVWAYSIFDGSKYKRKHLENKYYTSGKEYLIDILEGKVPSATSNLCKLYNKKVLDKGVRYKAYRCAQDGLFHRENLVHLNTIITVDYCGYYYRMVQIFRHESRAAQTNGFYLKQIECANKTVAALYNAIEYYQIDKDEYMQYAYDFKWKEFWILCQRVLFDVYIKLSSKERKGCLYMIIVQFSPLDMIENRDIESRDLLLEAFEQQSTIKLRRWIMKQKGAKRAMFSTICYKFAPPDTIVGKFFRKIYHLIWG